MSPFRKIESKKKSVYAAEQIVDAIEQGKFQVGDRLPSERELAELMGVSRPSVREALSALHIVGIVESRAGDGTYIRRALSNLEEAYPAFSLLEESDSLHEAYEARRVMEEGIVALACDKANAHDIQVIKAALDRMAEAATARDFEVFNLANQRFHHVLAEAAHNPLLTQALEPLLEVLHQWFPQQLRETLYESGNCHFQDTLGLHEKIYLALARRDRDGAVAAMRHHFDVFEKELNE